MSVAPCDVVGFGVNTVDLTALIDGYPGPDTKQPMADFDIQGGGMTATALVACARLGLRARYIGKVGGDFWARVSLRTLRREGIDVRHVLRARESAGHVSLVLVDRRSGTRTLFFRRPAAYGVAPEELDRAVLTSGRLLHVQRGRRGGDRPGDRLGPGGRDAGHDGRRADRRGHRAGLAPG